MKRQSKVERTDSVVVVGGGPVGLLTALKLARRGIPVTVLEAGQAIMTGQRAAGHHPCVVDVFERVGVRKEIERHAIKATQQQMRRVDGTLLCTIDISQAANDAEHAYGLALGQDSISRILLEHLSHHPHFEIRYGHRVTAISQNGSRAIVGWNGEGVEGGIDAPWVIGADGARSSVRTLLGIPFEGLTWPEQFVAVNIFYDFVYHGYSRGQFIVDPVDWAIIIQIEKTGLWRVAYGEDADLSAEEVLRRLPERFKRMLPGHPDPSDYRIEQCIPYRAHQRAAATFRQGRVILAGDAAHITNPVGALGLCTGIMDADQLGDALAAVLKDGADEAVLDHYAEKRRRVFLEVTSVMATENKRRLSEKDPAKRAEDEKMLAALNQNPHLQLMAVKSIELLKGDWFDRGEPSPRFMPPTDKEKAQIPIGAN